MAAPVVLVTGANKGIGFHLARSLLEDGFRVAAFDLSVENLAALRAAYPDHLRVYRCDVTDGVQVSASVESLLREWGAIDILVNNACRAVFARLDQRTLDDTRTEFEVNFFGYLQMIRAVLPQMKAQGKGIIHNVSSSVGITGFPGLTGYASTKGAIEALTRTLALELAPYGITVNLVHPPLTNTESAAPLGVPAQAMEDPARVGRKLARKIQSTKPIITPDFKTAMALFLARHFPVSMGRLLAKMAGRAKQDGSRGQ
ncbi:MAG: SDR family NAD(P)-dependent oxidoreductase [Terriglobia bacterium]|jgi:NAD(P)-dependent dehydrogenase (short-subunit alcohol dehydrogenase family)